MASAVFSGTSLVNMFVRDCWVNGVRRLIVSPGGEEQDFFEIRTEWSDRNVLYLHRSLSDLTRLCRRLTEAFPRPRPDLDLDLDRDSIIQGLVKIKESNDIEEKLNEVEKLLKNTINLPIKYSRSEVVLTFFERSPLDQVLRDDKIHRIQPSVCNPVTISEIMRSNGFCLANTETIVFDESPDEKERPSSTDSAQNTLDSELFDSDLFFPSESEAYVTNLSYYHLVPFETDILE